MQGAQNSQNYGDTKLKLGLVIMMIAYFMAKDSYKERLG
jgi:hypothetical protein